MPVDKLQNLLNTSETGELGDIVRRARRMGDLTETLAAALGEEFAGSLSAANTGADGVLVVVAASPAWAARLRFEEDVLIAAAREAGESVERLQVRVASSA